MNDYTDKTAVLLVNIGTPDEPTVPAVRRYLSDFLNDKRVMDVPFLIRKLLVNLIIVPFRSHKSTKLYQQLWTPEGSPLLKHSKDCREKLQMLLGSDYEVIIAMRYGNPSLKNALELIKKKQFRQLVLFPVFPQYASSTTGTIVETVLREISKWYFIPSVKIIGQFFEHPMFIRAFVERIQAYQPDDWDHIIFSYHGLPLRHLIKGHPDMSLQECFDAGFHIEHSRYCYRSACYRTTQLIADALRLNADKYSVAFQSRLDKNWMQPFTNDTLIQKAKEGCRKVLVVCPAFVADCLETIMEIGVEYQALFQQYGGEKVQLVESLNDYPTWIEAMKQMIES